MKRPFRQDGEIPVDGIGIERAMKILKLIFTTGGILGSVKRHAAFMSNTERRRRQKRAGIAKQHKLERKMRRDTIFIEGRGIKRFIPKGDDENETGEYLGNRRSNSLNEIAGD